MIPLRTCGKVPRPLLDARALRPQFFDEQIVIGIRTTGVHPGKNVYSANQACLASYSSSKVQGLVENSQSPCMFYLDKQVRLNKVLYCHSMNSRRILYPHMLGLVWKTGYVK